MKTEDILNLDCTKQENKNKINKMLMKIKPVLRTMEKNKDIGNPIMLETLEQTMHGIMLHYNYKIQGINTYYENNQFKFYTVSILRVRESRDWIGNVYGITLWETIAKIIIKIYADILKERKEKE